MNVSKKTITAMLMQLVVTQKEHGNAFVIKVMKETELIV